jgi:hypothetical protein
MVKYCALCNSRIDDDPMELVEYFLPDGDPLCVECYKAMSGEERAGCRVRPKETDYPEDAGTPATRRITAVRSPLQPIQSRELVTSRRAPLVFMAAGGLAVLLTLIVVFVALINRAMAPTDDTDMESGLPRPEEVEQPDNGQKVKQPEPEPEPPKTEMTAGAIGLMAGPGKDGGVHLRWRIREGKLKSVGVQRKRGSTWQGLVDFKDRSGSFTDRTAKAGYKYTYRLQITDPKGAKRESAEVRATGGFAPKDVPKGKLVAAPMGAREVLLVWQGTPHSKLSYKVSRQLGQNSVKLSDAFDKEKRTIRDTGLKLCTEYSYKVDLVTGTGRVMKSVAANAETPAIDWDSSGIKPVDFAKVMIRAHGNDDKKGKTKAAVGDDGRTLHLSGNSWKVVGFPYKVTPNTVVEFDFKSAVEGEAQGIGLSERSSGNPVEGWLFQLHGTDDYSSAIRYAEIAPKKEWKHYVIPVGRHREGFCFYLVFIDDDDKGQAGQCSFRDVRVYERTPKDVFDPARAPLPAKVTEVNFKGLELKPHSKSRSRTSKVTIEGGGKTIRIAGNTGQSVPFECQVVEGTVLEFDFKSSAQGRLQGIGFNSASNYSSSRTFKLYGTKKHSKDTYEDYAASAPGWKHYKIQVGYRYTGKYKYLTLVNEQSSKKPDAEVVFKNVKIYDLKE